LNTKNDKHFSKRGLIALTTIVFFLLTLLINTVYQDEINAAVAQVSAAIDSKSSVVYEIFKNDKKISTIYDYDKFKEHVLAKYKDKLAAGDGKILFEDSVSIVERHADKTHQLDQADAYDKLIDKVKFVAKAVEVVETNTGKKYYVPNLTVWQNGLNKIQKAMATKDSKTSIQLKSNVTYSITEAPVEAVLTSDELVHKMMNDKNQTYVTQAGDTLSSVAEHYKITRAELLLLNPKYNEASTLMPNTELAVTSPDYKNKFTQVNVITRTEPIPYAVEYINDDTLYEDEQRVEVPGEDGEEFVQVSIKQDENDEEVLLNKLALSHIKDPVTQVIRRGTKEHKDVGTGNFIWPTASHRTSTEFGLDYLFGQPRFHRGLDINEGLNAHIMASDHGIVIVNEYNDVYGNYIIIDHQNGYYTLYAHLNKSNVRLNQLVEKGELIGYMGSTGLSTGNHVHFEIRSGINDKEHAQDPRQYIGD
jgi:murein DD-endopeptidase MepM/ murein hydrolase activator NlpD